LRVSCYFLLNKKDVHGISRIASIVYVHKFNGEAFKKFKPTTNLIIILHFHVKFEYFLIFSYDASHWPFTTSTTYDQLKNSQKKKDDVEAEKLNERRLYYNYSGYNLNFKLKAHKFFDGFIFLYFGGDQQS
jgi:hypothetical protein